MNKTFKNFDKIIDRYISINLLNKAIDKGLAIDTYINDFTNVSELIIPFVSVNSFNEIYQKYLLGEEIDKYFFNDEYIKYLFTNEEIEKLIYDKKIIEKKVDIKNLSDLKKFKEVKSSNSNGLSLDFNILSKDFEELKSPIENLLKGIKLKIHNPNNYQYRNTEFRDEYFEYCKTLIFFLEVKRKLNDLIKNNLQNKFQGFEEIIKKLEIPFQKFNTNELSTEQNQKNVLTNKIEGKEYPEVFKNNGFVIFEHFYRNYFIEKTKLADISFFYWKLFYDKYIYVKPTPFRNWVEEKYQIELKPLKTLDRCKTRKKNDLYQSILIQFKNKTLS